MFFFNCFHGVQCTTGEAAGGKEPARPPGGGEEEDPDDVVLYLVKWRGLPYDQSSWDHFRDIRFASDQILDFWDFCRPRPKVRPDPPPLPPGSILCVGPPV